jgi:hypothetical protein
MTNNDADQQAVLPLASIAFTAWTSALLGLPEDLVDVIRSPVELPKRD